MPAKPNPDASEKQLEVFEFIIRHVEDHGFQPSGAEMARHFGVTKTAIQARLKNLARRGFIEYGTGTRERAIVLTQVFFKAHAVELVAADGVKE